MILVTTAGKVGAEAAQVLRTQGENVRVLVRDPDKYGGLRESGIEVVAGDLDDRRSIEAALADVDRIVLVSPAVPAQEQGVIAAAAGAGVGHIVKVTSKASLDSPVERRRGQAVIEQSLLESGVDHTLLRANAYMQNLLMLAPVIAATGGFAASTGRGQVGLTDARDVGAVAAAVITDPAQHEAATYWITGPELLSYDDVAATLSDVLDRPITFTARTREQDLEAMIKAGVPEAVAQSNAAAFSLVADGDAAWLSDDLTTLLGRPARDFGSFAREYAARFAGSAQAPVGP